MISNLISEIKDDLYYWLPLADVFLPFTWKFRGNLANHHGHWQICCNLQPSSLSNDHDSPSLRSAFCRLLQLWLPHPASSDCNDFNIAILWFQSNPSNLLWLGPSSEPGLHRHIHDSNWECDPCCGHHHYCLNHCPVLYKNYHHDPEDSFYWKSTEGFLYLSRPSQFSWYLLVACPSCTYVSMPLIHSFWTQPLHWCLLFP